MAGNENVAALVVNFSPVFRTRKCHFFPTSDVPDISPLSQKYAVEVSNFTTSWSDGLAFNALIHNFRPDLFDFPSVAKRHPNARLDHAFKVAQEHLKIERLLDPEGM